MLAGFPVMFLRIKTTKNTNFQLVAFDRSLYDPSEFAHQKRLPRHRQNGFL